LAKLLVYHHLDLTGPQHTRFLQRFQTHLGGQTAILPKHRSRDLQ
jgi:hypothetical protein